MTKKYWAYLLIAVGVAMIYSLSEFRKGTIVSTSTRGGLETQLASFALIGTAGGGNDTPYLAYGLLASGAWLLFGRKLTA
jgi:hypothetical protein